MLSLTIDTIEIPEFGEHPLRLASFGWTPLAFRKDTFRAIWMLSFETVKLGIAMGPPHFQTFIDHSDSLELLYNLPAIKTINHLDNVSWWTLIPQNTRIALLCPTMEMRNGDLPWFGKH